MGDATPLRERRNLSVAAFIFVVTFAVFAPAIGFDFVEVDDPNYVFDNAHVQAGLTADGLAWAFGGMHGSTWVPVTFTSFMLDRDVYGASPWGFHLTNVLLHALNAVLLFFLVARTTNRPGIALFVALFFALHPMRVEAVVWVTSRKDVLSTLLWFVALHAWVGFARDGRRVAYAVAMIAFAFGLGAKQMLVTLPVTLLILDVALLGRPLSLRLLIEKIPFAFVSFAGALIAYASQSTGAVTTGETLDLGARFGNAIVGAVVYLVRGAWPVDLAYLYPHPSFVPPYEGWPVAVIAGAAVFFIAMSAAAVLAARRGYVAVAGGWVWYVITLLPVVGIVQFGVHANADRFSYVPHVGIAFGLVMVFARFLDGRPAWRRSAIGIAVALLIGSSALTVSEMRPWKNSETLFRHAIEVTRDNGAAMAALGSTLARAGRTDEALPWLERAVKTQPLHAPAHASLGIVLSNVEGQERRAGRHLEVALAADPGDARAHTAQGNVYARLGRLGPAVESYRAAISLDSSQWGAYMGLARIAAVRGNKEGAARHFEEALSVAPDEQSRAEVLEAMRR